MGVFDLEAPPSEGVVDLDPPSCKDTGVPFLETLWLVCVLDLELPQFSWDSSSLKEENGNQKIRGSKK